MRLTYKLKTVHSNALYTLLCHVLILTKMYKKVETDKKAVLGNGAEFTPVATLADEWGGRCQISIDDHCYILTLKQENGTYKTTPYIFAEAFLVLKELPELVMP